MSGAGIATSGATNGVSTVMSDAMSGVAIAMSGATSGEPAATRRSNCAAQQNREKNIEGPPLERPLWHCDSERLSARA